MSDADAGIRREEEDERVAFRPQGAVDDLLQDRLQVWSKLIGAACLGVPPARVPNLRIERDVARREVARRRAERRGVVGRFADDDEAHHLEIGRRCGKLDARAEDVGARRDFDVLKTHADDARDRVRSDEETRAVQNDETIGDELLGVVGACAHPYLALAHGRAALARAHIRIHVADGRISQAVPVADPGPIECAARSRREKERQGNQPGDPTKASSAHARASLRR